MQAQFVTVEGIEGMGKSTVIETICRCLESHGVEYELMREPGGTPMAESIRQLLLEQHDESMAPLTEAFLFFAGRQQNIEHIIRPAMAAGKWVISDRFTESSLAYQGGGRGVPLEQLNVLKSMLQGYVEPTCTLLLDAPVSVGLSRIADRAHDRIEGEAAAFFERARAVYLALAAEEPLRYRTIAADQTVEQVQSDVTQVIEALIQSS